MFIKSWWLNNFCLLLVKNNYDIYNVEDYPLIADEWTGRIGCIRDLFMCS